jgi:L-ascorbate metabolism protein UlaG (beta-lactamase superfamily)
VTTARRRWPRVLLRLLGFAGVLLVALLSVVVVQGWKAFGHRAQGLRLARMQRSPQYRDGHFVNPQPLVNSAAGMLKGLFEVSPDATPRQPVPVERVDPARFQTPPPRGLRITWLGHSTTLIEQDGVRILTDPLWSERISPLDWLGPRRWYPPLIALADLPPIDAVVISHDHYDHLDYPTIVAMKEWKTRFVVPLGVGAHLAYWGIPEERIIELDWWERTRIGALELVCTPARHASGRTLLDKDATLWAGYALITSNHRVYYSGDTGLFPAMKQIGARLGPFDLAMIEAGQYNSSWPDWHIGPEGAVKADSMVEARVLLPVHWALLTLAYHGWTEPVERVLAAAAKSGAEVATPRPGAGLQPGERPLPPRWWPDLPWKTAAQDPLVTTGNP